MSTNAELDMTQRLQLFLVNSFADNPKTTWGKKELELELYKLFTKFLQYELANRGD